MKKLLLSGAVALAALCGIGDGSTAKAECFFTLGEAVTTLQNGQTYFIYDADASRYGFRYDFTTNLAEIYGTIDGARVKPDAENLASSLHNGHVWVAETSDEGATWNFRNADTGRYILVRNNNGAVNLGATANGSWTITGDDAASMTVYNTAAPNVYWNGNPNNMATWNEAHPYSFYVASLSEEAVTAANQALIAKGDAFAEKFSTQVSTTEWEAAKQNVENTWDGYVALRDACYSTMFADGSHFTFESVAVAGNFIGVNDEQNGAVRVTETAKAVYTLEKTIGGYYLKNVFSGKYIRRATDADGISPLVATANEATVYHFEVNDYTGDSQLGILATFPHELQALNTNPNNSNITRWDFASSDGSFWKLTEVSEAEVALIVGPARYRALVGHGYNEADGVKIPGFVSPEDANIAALKSALDSNDGSAALNAMNAVSAYNHTKYQYGFTEGALYALNSTDTANRGFLTVAADGTLCSSKSTLFGSDNAAVADSDNSRFGFVTVDNKIYIFNEATGKVFNAFGEKVQCPAGWSINNLSDFTWQLDEVPTQITSMALATANTPHSFIMLGGLKPTQEQTGNNKGKYESGRNYDCRLCYPQRCCPRRRR